MTMIYGVILFDLKRYRNRVYAKPGNRPKERWEQKHVLPIRRCHYEKSKKHLIASSILFGFALMCYFMQKFMCETYKGNPWIQMHAYWHIFSAISLFLLVRCISLIHK